ncbi:protein LURP-one-related 12-like isoform X2 [Cornus florida]|uniref:protein LURP-one-related 12-like isoform X2 n=1 Tax=Cornus florida TaxID=4283 RepID=UPI00289A5993|nr:protein LURP-one-related 12-like isoform X2 [Cornus florida]
MGRGVIVDERFWFQEETRLTVHKTSLFFPGDGFTVYDSQGELILRVDSYGPDSNSRDELFLMDSSGKCLLTLCRKASLHQRWEGFLGERMDGQEPRFSVYRSSIIRGSGVVVQVYDDAGEEYQIDGSFGQRSCTVYSTCSDSSNSSKEVVAEIKRKVDPTTNVLLGKDVFLLCLMPMIDSAFVMGLVLVLDRMVGDDADEMDSSSL